MQAKDFSVTVTDGEKTFEVLSPAGANAPAEFRLQDDGAAPTLLPYLSIKAGKTNTAKRKVSLLFIKPIEKDGLRIGQNVFQLSGTIDMNQPYSVTEKDVELLLGILKEDFMKEVLSKAIAPN